MAAFTGTGGADTADAAAGLLTGFTGGTLALLQDLIGDSFNGLAGDDYISAGAGDDTIVGGAGIDSLFGNGGSDLFQLANGDFTAGEMIDGGSGDDTISLTNTTTVNFSTGTLAAIESLIGSGGNDSITMSAAQFAGFSTIDAGSGTDTVTALFTGVIDLTGSWPVLTGIERLAFTGSAGNDTLVLTTAQFDAATVIDFGAGNDTLVVLSSLANFVWQPLVPTSGLNNLENVTVIDSDGSNTLGFSTSTRNFNVIANGGDDSVTTYNGNDTVNGGTGNDTINTLGGTDTAVYAGPLGNFSVTLNGDGSYTVTDNVGNEGVDILRNVEFLSFAGVTYAISSLLPPPSATFTGTGGNDVADYLNGILTGFTGGTIAQLQDSFADTFIGSDGNDTVIAGNGADTIIGGPGADYLLGREGADLFIYYTGDAAPGEYVHGDTGLDTILATGTVDFYGSSIIHIGGLVTGDAGCDLTIQNDHDFAYFQGGSGFDRITIRFGTAITHENISSTEMTITGIEELRIIDTVGAANSITCSDMGEYIDGGAGNDTISGRGGDDTATGGSGDDRINGGSGTADMVFYAGPRANYTVTKSGSTYTIVDNAGSEGTDTVLEVEYFSFAGVIYSTANILNVPATIGGTAAGGVTEDGTITTGGTLTITDPNPGEAAFQTTPATGPAYGTFTITSAGAWTYTLNNGLAAVQALKAGATLVDTITVASIDGTTFPITITITGTNDAPTVAALIPDQSATAGTAFSFTVPANTFADVDVGDTRSLTATLASGAALPGWLSFNPATGQFSGTPGAGDVGAITVRITASDGSGASVSDEFIIAVGAAANNPPAITSPATASVQENITGTVLDVNATDPEGATLTYALSGTDAALFNIDSATGVITFKTPPDFENPADSGADNVYNVTAVVSDGINAATQAIAITVTNQSFVISGSGNIAGTGEEDTISGASGADSIGGLGGNDVLNGNAGADTLEGGAGADTLNGGSGNDFASYFNDAAVNINLGTGLKAGAAAGDVYNSIEFIIGSDTGNDTMYGSTAADWFLGAGGNDLLEGSDGRDTLDGGAGSDTLNGAGGQDTMTSGAGADVFDFNGTTGTTANKPDTITDFEAGIDRIDVFDIDARAGTSGNQDFVFIGTAAFTAEGQLRVVQSGANTIVELNTTGTGGAESAILLLNVTATSLTAADFIL